MKKKKFTTPVRTVVKALKILEEIAAQKEAIGISELSKKIDIDKSTIFRILSTLQNMGYIEQKEDNQKYMIGLKTLQLSANILERNDLRTIALPYLIEIMEKTGETIHLGVLSINRIVYIDKIDSNQTIRMVSKIGGSVDVYCTALGKSILAFMKKGQVNEIIKNLSFQKHTKNTIDSPELFLAHLEEISKIGYAIDYEENEEHVRCVGAPIFNNDEVIAAISISGPSFRLSDNKISELGFTVVEAARKISNDLKLMNFKKS